VFAGPSIGLDVVVLDDLEPALLLALLKRRELRGAMISMSIWSANFFMTSGARAALASSTFRRSTIGCGVPVGT
jgi:hypothetical protein